MGKYENSELHNQYSDFHWGLGEINPAFKKLYVSDLDRVWAEFDFKGNKVVGIQDIKTMKEANYCMRLSPTEYGVYQWGAEAGAQVSVVYISEDFQRFTIRSFVDGKSDSFFTLHSAEEYGWWLLAQRKGDEEAMEYLKKHQK